MNRQSHDLVQGTEEWHAFRLQHFGASEAAAMLGLSSKTTRTELLALKYSGAGKEVSPFVQKIFDNGHEVEALARPIAEGIIVADLPPATCSLGTLSASCDGLTKDGATAFEHKQWNIELAESVRNGVLPDEHQPQCQQIMLVTGAKRVLFVVSDGSLERCEWMFVTPCPEWQKRIVAGWEQFAEDLKEYKHVEVLPAPAARPSMSLPALSIQVTGSIALVDNLKVFGVRLQEFIDNLDKNPSDDQAFADSEAAIKTLQAAQDALEAAEQSALAQTASIDDMRRTVAMYREQARTTRLMLEKLVKARKETIRVEIVDGGKRRLAEHLAHLTKLIGKPYLPTIPADFAGVIKGKKTIASLHNAVDTELARAKIHANDIASNIMANIALLRELADGHAFLFNDEAQLVSRDADSLTAIVKSRIADHQAAEAKRLEEERERIRAEEQAKLQREEEARRRREEEERQREERECARRQEEEARRTQAPAPAVVPIAAAAQQRQQPQPQPQPQPGGATLTPGRPQRRGHWVAEMTADTIAYAVKDIVDALAAHPDLIHVLSINMDAVNKRAADPETFYVPGFRAAFIYEQPYGEVK